MWETFLFFQFHFVTKDFPLVTKGFPLVTKVLPYDHKSLSFGPAPFTSFLSEV